MNAYTSPTDTQGGGMGQLGLYRLFGDANGDGTVDQLDEATFCRREQHQHRQPRLPVVSRRRQQRHDRPVRPRPVPRTRQLERVLIRGLRRQPAGVIEEILE